ncbi:hypothetical protein F5883DRAFT_418828, partial [Diaporthe sp. PMI_573]
IRVEKEVKFYYFNYNIQNFITITLRNYTILYILNFINSSFILPSFITILL